jgi:hypothetical protein
MTSPSRILCHPPVLFGLFFRRAPIFAGGNTPLLYRCQIVGNLGDHLAQFQRVQPTGRNLLNAKSSAVNITGDSDSTGAITGNILGAALGIEQIPARWLDTLELREVITEIADDLASVKQWRISSGEYRRSPEEEAEENWWMTKYPGW